MKIKKIRKVEPEDAIVLGIDASLNGAAFVIMKNFKVLDFWYFTNVVKDSKNPQAVLNRETGIQRLDNIISWYSKLLGDKMVDYAAIEDYAYGAKGNSIFQIGGLGEAIRLCTFRAGIPYREYEPTKIKKFATGGGKAEKSQMVLSAFKDGFDVGKYGKSGEDLADAYWIAKMICIETFIHRDKDYVNNLNKKQQETLTESTKAYPTPIINRPFISNRG